MSVYIIGLICFVLGCLAHSVLSSFLSLGRAMILCRHMILDCLYISLVMVEDISFIRGIKMKEMRDLGVTEKTISHSQKVFDKTMDSWKDMCIQKILTSYPTIARGTLKFDDWDSAMEFLQENR